MTPDDFTIRHLEDWVEHHAPRDPDVDVSFYVASMIAYLNDSDGWEWACEEGWPSAWRDADAGGWFDGYPWAKEATR